MTTQRIARWQLLAAAVLFSTGGVAIKLCDLTSVQVACFRSGVAAFLLILLRPRSLRGWTPGVLAVSVAFAATLVLFVSATKLTTSANAIFLQATAPLYILLLGPMWLRERLRLRDLIVMGVIALGMSLFFIAPQSKTDTAPDPGTGNLLATLSGVTWAFTVSGLRWLSVGRRAESATVEPLDTGLCAVVAGNALACLGLLYFAMPFPDFDIKNASLVLYLGVFQIGIAYLCVSAGVKKTSAFETSLLLLAEPALNPVWVWLILGETLSPMALAGGVIIIGATTIASLLPSARPFAG
ncbi:MAG: DMT family transporter [Planctomycetota bacterium]